MSGVSSRPRSSSALINIDWMTAGVVVLAAALVAGAVIRTDAASQESQFGQFIGGLRSLGPTESLVLFEDGVSGGAADWSAGRLNDDHAGLGAVWLLDPGDTPLTRRITLPQGTVQGFLRIDLIAIDDWALEGLELALDGQPVLRQRFSSREGTGDAQTTERLEGEGIRLQARLDPARELGFGAGDVALAETRLTLEMVIDTPGPELELSITPLPAAGADPDAPAPVWAVDNLIVVAAGLP